MLLAKSFGVSGYRVSSPEELKPVLQNAISDDVPALIEIVVDPDAEASPWHLLVKQPETNP